MGLRSDKNYLTGKTEYFRKDDENIIDIDIGNVVKSIETQSRKIDPVGVLEYLTKSYLLENRTLIQGVSHNQWFKKNQNFINQKILELGNHDRKIESSINIAKNLRDLLIEEMIDYSKNSKSIGILLSGGLDSRIVAGILKYLQDTGIYSGNIVALTWGIKSSRDVNYAQRICKQFNWDWEHIENTPEILMDNIQVSASLGAEASPIHLHAIDKIANMKGFDTVIAGSYGDSVGRGEFSGIHVENLPNFIPSKFNINKFALLKQEIVDNYYSSMLDDAYNYRNIYKRNEEYQYREIEQEFHYMRRKLQTVFIPIMKKKIFYQLFTKNDTYSYMWSLDPSVRTDEVYFELFKLLPGSLNNLPWARDGKLLQEHDNSNGDKLEKEHHKYGLWLRTELKDYILNLVNSNEIRNIGFFNDKSLDNLIKKWPMSNTITTNTVDETISWLASLSLFIKDNAIQVDSKYSHAFKDSFNTFKGNIYTYSYLTARNYIRK